MATADLEIIVRDAAERTLAEDGFAVLAPSDSPDNYVQWAIAGGEVRFEVADPEYNGLTPLGPEQLAALSGLGLAKGEINFERVFAPGEVDVDRLTELTLGALRDVYGMTEPAQVEVTVDA